MSVCGRGASALTCMSPAVLYEICRPDSKALTVMLPVNTTVQDVISAVAKPGGDHVLVKMNSAGGLHIATGARAVPPAFCQFQHDGNSFFCGLISHRKSSAEAGRRRGLHRAGGQRETLHLHKQPSGETGEKRFFFFPPQISDRKSDFNHTLTTRSSSSL